MFKKKEIKKIKQVKEKKVQVKEVKQEIKKSFEELAEEKRIQDEALFKITRNPRS